jgi:hypothetical protein
LERRKVRSDKRQTVIAEKKEELKQSQLFIKTGGKEGKDTVTNVWGTDVEAEKEAIAAKEANIAKLIEANKKATEADAKFKKKATTKSKDSSIMGEKPAFENLPTPASIGKDMNVSPGAVVKTRVGRIPQAELEKMSAEEVRAAAIAGKAHWGDLRAAKDRRTKARRKADDDDAVMRRDRALVAETNLDAFDALGPSRLEARALRRRKDQDRAMQQESFGLNLPTPVAIGEGMNVSPASIGKGMNVSPASIGKQAPIKLPPSVKQTPKAMIGAKPVRPSMAVRDYEGGYKDWKKAQDNYKMELKEWKTQKTNDESAEQINAAGAAVANAATPSSPTIINAPTSNVNSNKTDITSTSKSLVNPNPIVEKLNAM